jgi:hypothetical protein
MDVDLLIKRCGLVCRKAATCLQNPANWYVIKEREQPITTWFLQQL